MPTLDLEDFRALLRTAAHPEHLSYSVRLLDPDVTTEFTWRASADLLPGYYREGNTPEASLEEMRSTAREKLLDLVETTVTALLGVPISDKHHSLLTPEAVARVSAFVTESFSV